jgi:hypothetical protein
MGEDEAVHTSQLDRLQPDGNFDDEPPSAEQIEAQKRSEELALAREAARVGPRHPAHDFHAQWRKDHGLPPLDDKPSEP